MRVLLLLPILALAQDPDALLEAARAKAAKSDFVGAVIDHTRALEADPKLAPAWFGRAEARRELKDLEGAIEDLTSALAIEPRNAEAHVIRGTCRADRKDHAGAVADYTRALELGAEAPLVFALRGVSRAHLGRHSEALLDLDRAIAGGHGSALAYASRSATRFHLMDLRGAVSDATRSIQRQPRNVRAYTIRGLAYFALGAWENARRDFQDRIALSGSLSATDVLWVSLARSRLGERKEALREFRAAREATEASQENAWIRAVLGFLLGESSDAELLTAAGQGEEAKSRALDAHFYIGQRLVLEGKPDDAARHFERAAGDEGTRVDSERILARAELERLRLERRKVVLDALEERFRAQKLFRAEFKATGLTGTQDERSVRSFEVWYDRAASRLLVSLRGRDEQSGRDWEGHVAAEGLTFFSWGILDKAVKVDATPFFKGLEKWDRDIREEFDRLLHRRGERREDPAPMESTLVVEMEPKVAKDQEGSFRFAVGKGGRPASWLREPRRSLGVAMEEKEGEVVFEFSSPRKTIVVDRATGFLRSLRTVDFDGKSREILLTSFRPIERFPDGARPATYEVLPVDFAQVEGRWKEQRAWLEALLDEAMERWDDVTRSGRPREVQVLVTRWAARYADALRTYALKALARVYVRRRLDQGTPLADLAGDEESARFAEACKAEEAEVERFIHSRLDELVAEVETRAIEAPIDSRRHGALGELLKASFEYRTVEEERSRSYGDRSTEAFKEELDAQRKL